MRNHDTIAPYETCRLANGLGAVISPRSGTNVTTLLVMAKVGSRQEPEKIAGMSHFVEHMFFKGTKKRPTAQHISKDLDSVGAMYNAFTSKDYTGYYVTVYHKHFARAADVLADMLWNARFPARELKRESRVIVEEINMYEDNPMAHVEDMLTDEVFRGSRLGRNIAGYRETVLGIRRTHMTDFVKRHYNASNMVACLAGHVDDRARDTFEQCLGEAKRPGRRSSIRKFSGRQRVPRLSLKHKDTEQVQVAIGFPAYSREHKDLPALKLLANILGGTMSSRLFVAVRERRGLAYFIRAGVDTHEDTGMLAIQSGLVKRGILDAIPVILGELATVKKSGVTAAELKRSRDALRGTTVLGLENSWATAQFYAKQELFDRAIVTPEELLAKYEAVTLADIRRVARDILREQRMSMAVIGPFEDEAPLRRLIKL